MSGTGLKPVWEVQTDTAGCSRRESTAGDTGGEVGAPSVRNKANDHPPLILSRAPDPQGTLRNLLVLQPSPSPSPGPERLNDLSKATQLMQSTMNTSPLTGHLRLFPEPTTLRSKVSQCVAHRSPGSKSSGEGQFLSLRKCSSDLPHVASVKAIPGFPINYRSQM